MNSSARRFDRNGRRSKPVVAITVGDVAGIGPEIALTVAAEPECRQRCVPLLYGPAEVLRRIADHLSLAISDNDLVDVGALDAASIHPGRFSVDTGRSSYEAVCRGIDDANGGIVDAIVTGPIQKEAWHAASVAVPGHTELLADRTNADRYAMMLAGDELACVLVTIHVPLADVPGQITTQGILQTIRLAAPVAKARGRSMQRSTIAVCGLNPHAGENGLMSHGEEEKIIVPAIEAARESGLDVIGPLPPDTAFTPAMRKRVDVYVCMYHDQGLIPLKALAFDHGINVTLGLPLIRTSVDHGTAMDLAWQGVASPTSLRSALHAAIDLVDARDRCLD